MEKFRVENFGPIQDVDVNIGDLTILIGAQASGKSLFLQLFKLVKDRKSILRRLDNYGFVVRNNADNLLNRFLGEGLCSLWTGNTEVVDNGIIYNTKDLLVKNPINNTSDKVFYIPAQRILSIADGRPKNFMEFGENDPYVLRSFSEILRLFVHGGLGGGNVIYPLNNRLKGSVKKMLNENIFHNGKVVMDEKAGQRKIAMEIDGMHLPLMTWSAGQKEFLPLLMAFYCLSGPVQNVINSKQYEYIIIEEPEMGLHPLAIQTIILQIIEFIHNGYKVIVSTHSPVLLEFVWVYNALKNIDSKARVSALAELFRLSPFSKTRDILNDIYNKKISTYFFTRNDEKVVSKDISSLDVMEDNIDIVEWGGLTQFSNLANDLVSKYIAKYEL